jgi:hypothetical protein
MIGKMTLEGHFKKMGMIGMITLESFRKLLDIFGDKENASNQMNSFTQKKCIGISVSMQDTFRLRQEKKNEQRKTKIDVDEFRSGTTNITHL